MNYYYSRIEFDVVVAKCSDKGLKFKTANLLHGHNYSCEQHISTKV